MLSYFQPEKAMGMLTYIEKTVFSNTKANVGSTTPDKGDNKNDNKDSADSNTSLNDAWKLKISLVRSRSCLIKSLILSDSIPK